MKKNVKMYNVLFPIWIIFLLPPVILLVLPGNFIIDSLVLLIGMACLKISNKKKIYLKTILKVWIVGFVADIIGSVILLGTQLLPYSMNSITTATATNPFTNIYSLILVILAVLVSGICIYILNFIISFRKIEITVKKKKGICLVLAVMTAPYLFFIPSTLMYKTDTKNVSEVQVYLKENQDIYLGDNSGMTKSFQDAFNICSSQYKSNIKEIIQNIIYEIDTKNSTFNVKIKVNSEITAEEQEDLMKSLKEASFLTILTSLNTENVTYNITNKGGESIAKEILSIEDIKKEYNVDIEELKQDYMQVEKIIAK